MVIKRIKYQFRKCIIWMLLIVEITSLHSKLPNISNFFTKQVKALIDQYDQVHVRYRTCQLWITYLNMIEILLSYLHAERGAVWQEHLSATAHMADYIAAADHNKYIKTVVCYLQEMRNLETEAPSIHDAFERGEFTVKRSVGNFNTIWTDMALECSQNCDTKGRFGQIGLKSITTDTWAREKWFKTLPFAAAVTTSMREMLQK